MMVHVTSCNHITMKDTDDIARLKDLRTGTIRCVIFIMCRYHITLTNGALHLDPTEASIVRFVVFQIHRHSYIYLHLADYLLTQMRLSVHELVQLNLCHVQVSKCLIWILIFYDPSSNERTFYTKSTVAASLFPSLSGFLETEFCTSLGT